MIYQRILVPIDFSDDALSAYQVALDYYAGNDKTLILLHVIEDYDIERHSQTEHDYAEGKKRQLRTLGNSRKDEWKEVVVLIESGKPIDKILGTVKLEEADLVVMGSHGSGGIAQGLFGSTTYSVARKVKCSVMISKHGTGN
jgi:nucleotide-binding universal stress UspA family protein